MFQMSFGKPEMRITEVSVDMQNLRVRITAQSDGIIAAILRLLGINGQASLTADALGCRVESSGFTGQSRTYSAWQNVAASTYAVTKATGYLAAAFTLVITGISVSLGSGGGPRGGSGSGVLGIVFLALALGAFVLFLIKRSVLFGIVTSGGTGELMKLKGSKEQMEQLREAAKVIESLMRGDGQTAEE